MTTGTGFSHRIANAFKGAKWARGAKVGATLGATALLVGLISVVAISATQVTGEQVTCIFQKTGGELESVTKGERTVLPLKCGGAVASFTFAGVETDPDTVELSNQVLLSGFEGEVEISLEGHNSATLYRNGAPLNARSGIFTVGDRLAVEMTSGPDFDDQREVTIRAGDTEAVWTVTVRPQITDVGAVSIADNNEADPSASESNSVTLPSNGWDGPVNVGISGPGSPLLSTDGINWSPTVDVHPGDTLHVRGDSHTDFDGTVDYTVEIGTSAPVTWTVNTRPMYTTPASFSLSSDNYSQPGTWRSTSFTPQGSSQPFDGTLPVTASGSGQVSLDNSSWSSSVTPTNGQTVYVRLENASGDQSGNHQSRSTTITLGNSGQQTSSTFNISNWYYQMSSWGGWGGCSASCGGGTQYRSRSCQWRTSSGWQNVSNTNCGGQSTSQSQSCNTHSCYSYSWYTGGWGTCQISGSSATKYRSVYCRRSDGASVSSSYCSGGAPSSSTSCSRSTQTRYIRFRQFWACQNCGGSAQPPRVGWCDQIVSQTSYPGCSAATGEWFAGVSAIHVYGACPNTPGDETHRRQRYCFN